MKLHLLFAPHKPWRNLSPAYKRTHDKLRREVKAANRSRKQIAHKQRSERFKATAELI